MAGGEVLVVFWKEWGIQALVLLSFTLQVILLISAEIRQRKDSGVLRVIVWSAYLLADTTAIYALGHMSVTTTISSSRRLRDHQLVAFWAPFLLLHLGGQDNITAYSIEDNRLWLRHLQTFVVQVLASGYVLYESPIVGRRPATILMFAVGVIKYGERVWALKCASTSNLSGKNYRSFGRLRLDKLAIWANFEELEGLLSISHHLLNFPKHLLKGPLPVVELDIGVMPCEWEQMYQVAEVQLLLMYEVFYSKAPVIYTWYGLCIRVASPVATVIALQLFRRSAAADGYYFSRADVAVTYVLLVGSVVLEITSLLRAMFSSWAHEGVTTLIWTIPRRHIYGLGKLFCRWLKRVVPLPRFYLKRAMRRAGVPVRYWSGTMGQQNLIHLCTKSKHSRSSKMARWLGREDWWNTLFYTSSVPVPADFSRLLEKQLLRSVGVSKEHPDHINNSRGRAALKGMGILQEGELASWSVLDIPLDESILVWHIATHVYLSWYHANCTAPPDPPLAAAIEVLSNHMLFLLAARPYMLPDNASRQSYVELCNELMNHLTYSSSEDLVRLIRQHGEALHTGDGFTDNLQFNRASQLGEKLIAKNLDMLEFIAQVWVEMLCYASYRCRPDSHARQLSNGGEVATVVAILMEYMKSGLYKHIRLPGFYEKSNI